MADNVNVQLCLHRGVVQGTGWAGSALTGSGKQQDIFGRAQSRSSLGATFRKSSSRINISVAIELVTV